MIPKNKMWGWVGDEEGAWVYKHKLKGEDDAKWILMAHEHNTTTEEVMHFYFEIEQ